MCGRYCLFAEEEYKEMMKILNEINSRYPDTEIKSGDIFPTNTAPVFKASGSKITTEPFIWGFPGYKDKSVIINARAETIEEKRMFSSSFLNNRCIIPATGFYEWDKIKRKYLFSMQSEPIFYMAGLHNTFNSENRFVILTTEANASMQDIHNRMPVVLTKANAKYWLNSIDSARNLLFYSPPPLIKCLA